MARTASALYASIDPTAPIMWVELFVAEGGYQYGDGKGQNREVRYRTVLLNFDIRPEPFSRFPELSASMRSVREYWWCFSASTQAGWELPFPAVRADRVNLLVQLPDRARRTSISPQWVDEVLEAVYGHQGQPLIAVGISPFPQQWTGLRNLQSYVASDAPSLAQDAGAVFKMLASCMAPSSYSELDEADFQQALGTAVAPSRVVHARWAPHYGHLELGSQEAGATTKAATRTVLVPLWSEASLSSSVRLVDAWRACAGVAEGAVLYPSLTQGFFVDHDPLNAYEVPVVALCRVGSTRAAGHGLTF